MLRQVLALERSASARLPWLTFAPVDVSIPLLLTAATQALKLFAAERATAKDISSGPQCTRA